MVLAEAVWPPFASVCARPFRYTPTEPLLDGPAIWTAEVRDGKVAVWRVYEDTPEVRARLGIP